MKREMPSGAAAADRQLAESTASKLRQELLPCISGPIQFRRTLTARVWDTDGWCVSVARLQSADQKVNLELWYDTFGTHGQRCFWVGFSSSIANAIQQIVQAAPSSLRPKDRLTDSDIADHPKYSILKVAIVPRLNLQPILETYKAGHNFYGMYDLTAKTVRDRNGPLDEHAVQFLKSIFEVMPEFDVSKRDGDYQSFENRLKVAWHLQRERDSKLAARRKELDNYRCQVCFTRLEEIYGELGHNFAEAHHVVWLSKLKGPVERNIGNLRTVCPNCHRMLHKMTGEPGDIEKLQTLIRGFQKRVARPVAGAR